jgi:L-asparagine transporter-like permease
MESFKNYIFLIISAGFGLFVFSNIILPILYSLPRLRRERKAGNLIKNVPISVTLIPVISWSIILTLILYYSRIYFETRFIFICIGLVISAILIIITLIKKNPDMNDDFNDTYKDYLKNRS